MTKHKDHTSKYSKNSGIHTNKVRTEYTIQQIVNNANNLKMKPNSVWH
jgi:hypothetical protein